MLDKETYTKVLPTVFCNTLWRIFPVNFNMSQELQFWGLLPISLGANPNLLVTNGFYLIHVVIIAKSYWFEHTDLQQVSCPLRLFWHWKQLSQVFFKEVLLYLFKM